MRRVAEDGLRAEENSKRVNSDSEEYNAGNAILH